MKVKTKIHEGLPEFCYCEHPETKDIVLIKRGESGFYPWTAFLPCSVDALNQAINVTKAQARAMFHGSMIGWDTPGADPNQYDDEGIYLTGEKATIKRLEKRVPFTLVPANDPAIFAAGPITKQPGTLAFRYVMKRIHDSVTPFVTAIEIFPDFPNLEKSYQTNGRYFGVDDLDKAVAEFGNRIKNGAECVKSCYRDE